MFTIEERNKTRKNFNEQGKITEPNEFFLMAISQSIDDYIEHRIQTDKVVEGILKDIQGNVALMAETRIEKILTENLN